MAGVDLKDKILWHLNSMSKKDFKTGALELLKSLGYSSDKTLELSSKSPTTFLENFQREQKLNEEKALFSNWKTVDFLFQLTEDELKAQHSLFSTNEFRDDEFQSYLFIALELIEPEKLYHRSQFAAITREINKLFNMPVMILFKTGAFLTFSIIHRRPHKRDHSRDVLEKVTLIKDISLRQPHRAQVEILYDLSLQQLKNEHPVTNFLELHHAWQQKLDISVLNDNFYKQLEKWYFWAIKETTFPDDGKPNSQERHLIRLITRLIFVWFIKEKGWVPSVLFDKLKIDEMLNKIDSTGSTYYKAILQNLFFATLNTEMGSSNRCFVTDSTFRLKYS